MVVREILSIGLLAIALYSGFERLPLWSIFLIAVAFAIAYVQGKWCLWRDLFVANQLTLHRSRLATYLIQIVVVATF